jgi:hypothetical protein
MCAKGTKKGLFKEFAILLLQSSQIIPNAYVKPESFCKQLDSFNWESVHVEDSAFIRQNNIDLQNKMKFGKNPWVFGPFSRSQILNK